MLYKLHYNLYTRRKMSKKTLLILAFLTVLAAAIYLTAGSKPSKTPESSPKAVCPPYCNVLFISIDDLRADHLGVYGYQKPTSPNIDQFAREGIVFENAFAQSSWTLPSYASMLMGQYPQKLGVEVISDRLPENTPTLAEILKNNGYKTAAFTSGAFINQDRNFTRGFDKFEEEQNWQDAESITDKAISFLSENQNTKFFLFLHYFHVHDPYSPSNSNAQKFHSEYGGNIKSFNISDIVKLNTKKTKLSREDLQHIVALYDAEIFELDNQLGILFQFLNKKKLDKNTVIIINSDHGEEFGERGTWGMHAYSVYDELLHIPLIVKVPNIQSKRVDSLVENRDIPKTIVELLELTTQTNLTGENLIKIAKGEKGHDYVYAETAIQKQQMLQNIEKGYSLQKISDISPSVLAVLSEQKRNQVKTKMIRTRDYKLIKNFVGKIEIYNLKDDPKEKTNLSGKGLKEESALLELLNTL